MFRVADADANVLPSQGAEMMSDELAVPQSRPKGKKAPKGELQAAREEAKRKRHALRRRRRTEEKREELQLERKQRKHDRRQVRERLNSEAIRETQRWRWSDGGMTFFNLRRRDHVAPVVEDLPLDAEEIPGALVSRLKDPSLAPGNFSGAVYRHEGHAVSEFLELDALTQDRLSRRVNAPVMDQKRLDDADRLYDTCIYLGRWSPRFGPFLLESLARAWYLIKADRSIPVIFHGWSDRPAVPSFASAVLAALHVQPSRIKIVANRDLRVRSLILPRAQFWPGIKASPGMCVAFDHVREKMLQGRSAKARTPEKVYFSRRGLDEAPAPGRARSVIVNEEEAETVFRTAGYEILQPELLPMEQQVAIVANATHVAGASGSALHLMMFNANPRAKLIELRTRTAVDQLMISAIRGHEAFHVSCRSRNGSPERIILDMEVVERAIREIAAG
ncbi:MAG: glycosyltransferase family 61 protein [Reyranella sp.]